LPLSLVDANGVLNSFKDVHSALKIVCVLHKIS